MKVDLYEKIWIVLSIVMIVSFLGAVMGGAARHAAHPPSHMETLEPTTVWTEGEFANEEGVELRDDGSVLVRVVAEMYVFRPEVIRVPAGRPVTFRLTSADVIHGFQVVRTNANTMVIPGYVSQLTTTFEEPGEYLIACNEYCGLSHHLMQGRLIVEDGF